MRRIQMIVEFFFRKKWLGILLVLSLVIGTGISTVYRGAFGPKQRTDLAVYFKAAEMVRIGRANHIYGIETDRNWHYVYSPFLAILLAPVSALPFVVPVTANYLLGLLCLFGVIFLSFRFTSTSEDTRWKVVLAAFLSLPVILNTLTRGQLGLLMLFFQAAILFCYLRNYRILTGLLLSLAVTIKASPLAALFFFFLFRKEWKILASTVFFGAVFSVLYPSVIIGFGQNRELLGIWRNLMAEGSSIAAHRSYLWSELFTPFAEDNQSVYAVLTRFAWKDEASFIAHPSNRVRLLSAGLGLLGMFFLYLQKGRNGKTRPAEITMTEFSLYPVWMLLFSPVTQIHHYTSLYFLFLAALFLYEPGKARSRLLGWSLLLSTGLFFSGLIFDPLAYLGIPMWGSLGLWSVLLFICFRPRQAIAG
ncbi:MAG: hypothetical protein BWY42_01374 [Candidatus Omnitrophica bacterium ADurb.Bin277]|nr:MAG: hypothetical protein BWY42_01374 [Candidatus Omnitrophica bacterium ADurb.Bin277]